MNYSHKVPWQFHTTDSLQAILSLFLFL